MELKDEESSQIFQEIIIDLKEKLERKEFIMQLKERKWGQVDKLLTDMYSDDHILLGQLSDIKYQLNSRGKISNVVEENERLKIELDNSSNEIIQLRKKLFLASKPSFLSEEFTDSGTDHLSGGGVSKHDEDWQQYSQNLENCINFMRKKVTQLEKQKYEQ